jgi:5-methylthioadenosine/S-adenosylhomocysteine deaminase
VDSSLQSGRLIFPEYLIDRAGAPVKQGWGVRLVGDLVDAVGPQDVLRERYPDDQQWNAPRQVLSPGFVDAHTHLTGLLAHGMPRPAGLTERSFLDDFWWPAFTDRLDRKMVAAAVESCCFHYLRGGVTTVATALEAPQTLPGILSTLAQILDERGIRALLSYIASERHPSASGEAGLAENLQFWDACAAGDSSTLLTCAIAIDGMAVPSQSFVAQARQMAEERAALFHIHTRQPEQILSLNHTQRRVYTPITEYRFAAEKLSLLTLTNGDKVGLGSDGVIFDFFRVMRSAQRQSRGENHGHLLSAAQIWALATEGGAQALGFQNVGRLAAGWQADLQLININFPSPVTAENLYDQLLRYGSSEHVQSVLVDGEIRVSGGVVLNVDAARVREQAHLAALRLWGDH